MKKALAAALAAIAALAAAAGAAAQPSVGEADRVAIGAFIQDSYRDPALYDEWAQLVGRRPAILGSYKTWTIPLIDAPQLEAIWQRGATPMITWEPWGEEGGPVFKLGQIADGVYDGYIRRSAESAAVWGRPLFVRFAHEMNGAWYPWGRGKFDNDPRIYKRAWKRIVGIFERAGADNVKWVWCPNENSTGRFAFRQYYPGDRWVDWVALDGFNWSVRPRWESFDEIFASSYNSLVQLTERPIMIAETGTWETGGDKAEWVREALTRDLPELAHVRAFLWWSVDDPRGDLRVNSSPNALRAVREGFSLPLYAATRPDLLSTPELLGPGREVAVPGSAESVIHRVGRALRENHLLIGVAVLVLSVLALVAVLVRIRRRPPASSAAEPSFSAPSGDRHEAPL